MARALSRLPSASREQEEKSLWAAELERSTLDFETARRSARFRPQNGEPAGDARDELARLLSRSKQLIEESLELRTWSQEVRSRMRFLKGLPSKDPAR